MFDAIGIAGSGLTVHRKWLDAVADNLANANTVRATDDEAFRAAEELGINISSRFESSSIDEI